MRAGRSSFLGIVVLYHHYRSCIEVIQADFTTGQSTALYVHRWTKSLAESPGSDIFLRPRICGNHVIAKSFRSSVIALIKLSPLSVLHVNVGQVRDPYTILQVPRLI